MCHRKQASRILCKESMWRSFFMASVVLDAGHGGSDPGAVYDGRQEKDDVLRLTKAVGNILEKSGVAVAYTRTEDQYDTPFQKAMKANETGADYLISIHRNSSATPNTYNGTQTLVYADSGVRSKLARNINNELVDVGFRDAGIVERPNLVVLKRTRMPAALVEVGFINNDTDNRIFDEKFDEIAQGIANGILTTIYGGQGDQGETTKDYDYDSKLVVKQNEEELDMMDRNGLENRETIDKFVVNQETMQPTVSDNDMKRSMEFGMAMDAGMYDENKKLYRVQVGAYQNKDNADRMLNSLLSDGFPAFMIYDDGLYKVQVGAYQFLPNAIRMENNLRRYRYSTYITT